MAEHNWLDLPLKTADDWVFWYAAVKYQAIAWDIWGYIDPDTPEESLSKPPYRGQGIYQSVTPEIGRLVMTQSLRATLLMLKTFFGRTDSWHRKRVAATWDQLCHQTPSKSNFDGWILKLQLCYLEAEEIGWEESNDKERMTVEFLNAIGSIAPELYELWMNRIYRSGNKELPELPTLVDRYSAWVHVSAPRYHNRLARAATFQGREVGDRKKHRCPCENAPNKGDHSFSECPYVNPSVRQGGWRPDDGAEKRFKRATKSKQFNKAYTKALEKFQPDSFTSS
ncbi:hypothetical protein N7535_001549 [Penicillium sp. DV-2018c]|nr:hypothetical protein N7461_005207 [Penicillium sp. DV-2018c]KAJ5582929.1 hypothetical protein N7535_001549 [Penicillium sp. DV-2018c]